MQPRDYPFLFPRLADKVERYKEILDHYGSLVNCPKSWRLDASLGGGELLGGLAGRRGRFERALP